MYNLSKISEEKNKNKKSFKFDTLEGIENIEPNRENAVNNENFQKQNPNYMSVLEDMINWFSNEKEIVAFNLSKFRKYSVAKKQKNNPWAICKESTGREDKDKYEKCIKEVKKQNKKASSDKTDEEKAKNDQLKGGFGDTVPIDTCLKDQLLKGIQVEMEHTDDPKIALEIAIDHLVENDKYYDYLKDMEKKMDSEKKNNNF